MNMKGEDEPYGLRRTIKNGRTESDESSIVVYETDMETDEDKVDRVLLTSLRRGETGRGFHNVTDRGRFGGLQPNGRGLDLFDEWS